MGPNQASCLGTRKGEENLSPYFRVMQLLLDTLEFSIRLILCGRELGLGPCPHVSESLIHHWTRRRPAGEAVKKSAASAASPAGFSSRDQVGC